MSARCWRGECRQSCYYPEVCSETASEANGCHCPPCPGRGNDGHGLTHCAECCFGTGVEVEPGCPTHNPLTTCDAYPPPLTCDTAATSRRCTPCADAADDAEFERLHKRDQEARAS